MIEKELSSIAKLKKERSIVLTSLIENATMDNSRGKYNPKWKWKKPIPKPTNFCQAIIIENLSSLRPSLSCTRRENKIRTKLHSGMFCELLMQTAKAYGTLVFEVIPSYTSLYDSRTGYPGDRVKEVTAWKFVNERWIQDMVSEAKQRVLDNTPHAHDKDLISIDDRQET